MRGTVLRNAEAAAALAWFYNRVGGSTSVPLAAHELEGFIKENTHCQPVSALRHLRDRGYVRRGIGQSATGETLYLTRLGKETRDQQLQTRKYQELRLRVRLDGAAQITVQASWGTQTSTGMAWCDPLRLTQLGVQLEADAENITPATMARLRNLIGSCLFPAASRGLSARALLAKARHSLGPHKGLRIAIEVDGLLARVPWEAAHLPDQDGHLALDPSISIVRSVCQNSTHDWWFGDDIGHATPIDVLVITADQAEDPADKLATRYLGRERETAARCLAESQQGVPGLVFEPRFLRNATIDSVRKSLVTAPDVVHLIGHGRWPMISDTHPPSLLLGSHNQPEHVPLDSVASLLLPAAGDPDTARSPQLVILSTCYSGTSAFVGEAARSLIAGGTSAVIAMNGKVLADHLLLFSEALYSSLARGCSLDEAVSAARPAMTRDAIDISQFAQPLLYLADRPITR